MLSRLERFDAIATAEESRLVGLADEILAGREVRVLRAPAPASVMMRAIDTAEGSPFNLGEVLVTEAEVEIAGERGYAVVLGFRPGMALAGAVVDAAYEAGIGDRDRIEALLSHASAAAAEAPQRAWGRLEPTLVAFESIPS